MPVLYYIMKQRHVLKDRQQTKLAINCSLITWTAISPGHGLSLQMRTVSGFSPSHSPIVLSLALQTTCLCWIPSSQVTEHCHTTNTHHTNTHTENTHIKALGSMFIKSHLQTTTILNLPSKSLVCLSTYHGNAQWPHEQSQVCPQSGDDDDDDSNDNKNITVHLLNSC